MVGLTPNSSLRGEQLNVVLKEFLGVLQGFGELLQNPKVLNKTISDALQLSADEQKKLLDAKASIDQATGLRKEMERRETEMKFQHSQLDTKLSDIKRGEATNKEEKSRLEKLASEHAKVKQRHDEAEKIHSQKQIELDAREAFLNKRNAEFEEREKRIAAHESQLSDKADKLRRAAEGL